MAVGPYSFSLTAADNGTADSNVGMAEGQSVASINNGVRALMASLKGWINSIGGTATHGGSANAYTITNPSVAVWAAYADGMEIMLKPAATNTSTTVNVNVDGLGNKRVKNADGTDPAIGSLVISGRYKLVYDGTNLVLPNMLGVAAAGAQPLDATLTAFAAQTTGANLVWYWTGTDAGATTNLTAWARLFLAAGGSGTAAGIVALYGNDDANTLTTISTASTGRSLMAASTAAIARAVLILDTDDSPTFFGVNIENTDTTITRSAAGKIAVEGNVVAMLAETNAFTVAQTITVATGAPLIAASDNASFASPVYTAKAARAASAAYSFFEGTSDYDGTPDLEFKLSGVGNGTCDGSWTGGGADYAEYFEWADGNPLDEDRRGLSVVLEGDKIRPARRGEEPFGVISARPSVVGDAAWNKWSGKYLTDRFGAYIMEPYTVVEWIDTVEIAEAVAEGEEPKPPRIERKPRSYALDRVPEGVIVPADARRLQLERRKLNPAFDARAPYVPREDRPEWDAVGLMGKLRLRKGQPTGARWIKMADMPEEIEQWLVR